MRETTVYDALVYVHTYIVMYIIIIIIIMNSCYARTYAWRVKVKDRFSR